MKDVPDEFSGNSKNGPQSKPAFHLDLPSRIPSLRLAEHERCGERLAAASGPETDLATKRTTKLLEPSSLIVYPNHS
jgi:hypothetical protein